MNLKKKKENKSYSIKITAEEGEEILGWVYLYVMNNDLHKEPFGFLENVFVEEKYRGRGIGQRLVEEVANVAKKEGCYKLICTSRHEKPEIHAWYKKLGFKDHGKEFRIDF